MEVEVEVDVNRLRLKRHPPEAPYITPLALTDRSSQRHREQSKNGIIAMAQQHQIKGYNGRIS